MTRTNRSTGPHGNRPRLLLGFDLEDWEQLSGRLVGIQNWDISGVSLERQMSVVFDFLDEFNADATFFLLSMTIKNYPDIAREIASRGYEIASHGHAHYPVYSQSRDAFRRDVETSLETIDRLVGIRPRGYRSPAFSITRSTVWALEVLADLGFSYDSSLCNSPKVPNRIRNAVDNPFKMILPSGRSLVEFPIPTLRFRRWTFPIGGGSYWRVLPSNLLRKSLQLRTRTSGCAALYFHPYECDPKRLSVPLPKYATFSQRARAACTNLRWQPGRRLILRRLRHIAQHFQLVRYNEILEEISSNAATCKRTLSTEGVLF